jgi:hypothetical protein
MRQAATVALLPRVDVDGATSEERVPHRLKAKTRRAGGAGAALSNLIGRQPVEIGADADVAGVRADVSGVQHNARG